MRFLPLFVIAGFLVVSSIHALTCCMSDHVTDQAAIAPGQGFTDIVIDPNGTCDTAGISWSYSVMRLHYTYRLNGEDLITTVNTTVSGMPLEPQIDTSIGWCSISIEKGAESHLPGALTVSPSPARTSATIQFPNPGGLARLEVFNAAGVRVHEQKNITGSGVTIGMSGLGRGIYLVRVKTESRIFVGYLNRQ